MPMHIGINMARIKGGITTKRKHKKILRLAKGYRMTRHKQIKKAKEAIYHAGEYAFAGRKNRKRDFRILWIIRINAALSLIGLKYSKFIADLKKNKIQLDRKILSQLAVKYPNAFNKIVEKIK